MQAHRSVNTNCHKDKARAMMSFAQRERGKALLRGNMDDVRALNAAIRSIKRAVA